MRKTEPTDPYNAERWPLLAEAGVFAHADPRAFLDAVEAVLAGRRSEQAPVKATPVHSHRVVVLELDPWQTVKGVAKPVTTLQVRWTHTPVGWTWDADLLNDDDPAADPLSLVTYDDTAAAPWWVHELAERYDPRRGDA